MIRSASAGCGWRLAIGSRRRGSCRWTSPPPRNTNASAPGPRGDYEQTLTPRIVVSRDLLQRFNTTLNLDFPIALSGGNDVSFAWALGARYPDEGFARYGVELKQHAAAHQAVIFPQIWFAFPREMTLKLGVGIGLTPRTDPVVCRAVFEGEF